MAFYELSNVTARDVWTWSPDAGARPLLNSPSNERAAVFLHDGRWLAFLSDQEQVDEVFLKAYPGDQAATRLTTGGATEPVWSPVDNELFFRRGGELLSIRIGSDGAPLGPEQVVLRGDYELASPEVVRSAEGAASRVTLTGVHARGK